jgi:hypothetical protein
LRWLYYSLWLHLLWQEQQLAAENALFAAAVDKGTLRTAAAEPPAAATATATATAAASAAGESRR